MSAIFNPGAGGGGGGAVVVQSGTTVPVSPSTGELFLHTPTGRKVLMQWDGAAWQEIESYGAMAMFVDGLSGSNTINKGFGTGADAFLTIQYAVNRIPPDFTGNVTIKVGGNTIATPRVYREEVIIRGKSASGNFTITIEGDTANDVGAKIGALSASNPATGSGIASWGTLTDAGANWTVNAWRNKWIEITSGTGVGQVRLIHSNTATVVTTTGRWDTVPDSTSDFKIFDVTARVTGSDSGADTTPVRANGFLVQSGQKGVFIKRLLVNYTVDANIKADTNGGVTVDSCHSRNSVWMLWATAGAQFSALRVASTNVQVASGGFHCLIEGGAFAPEIMGSRFTGDDAAVCVLVRSGSACTGLYWCYGSSASTAILKVSENGSVIITGSMDMNGKNNADDTKVTTDVLFCNTGGAVDVSDVSGTTNGSKVYNSGGWGVRGTQGGVCALASLFTFGTAGEANVSGDRSPAAALGGGTT